MLNSPFDRIWAVYCMPLRTMRVVEESIFDTSMIPVNIYLQTSVVINYPPAQHLV